MLKKYLDFSKIHIVVSDSLKYFIGTVTASVFLFLKGILIARILGPSWFGVWGILMIILSYNLHSHFGLIHGMNKRVPYLRGKGNVSEAKEIVDTSFWSIVSIGAILAILLFVFSFILSNRFSVEIIIGLRMLSLIIFLHQVYIYLISLLRIDKNFNLLSIVVAIFPIVSLGLTVVFFVLFDNKLIAALAGTLLAYVVSNIIIFLKTKYRFQFRVNTQLLKRIFMVGAPLIVINIGYSLFITIDRWMIARFIGEPQLGYYALGASMGQFLVTASSTVAFVVYPRMLERYGKSGEVAALKNLTIIPLFALSVLMAFICALYISVIPLFIKVVVPAYMPGLLAITLFGLGAYFLCLVGIAGNFLISVDKQKYILFTQIGIIPFCLVVNYFLIKNGFGIQGVAVGMGVSFLLYSTTLISLMLGSFFKLSMMLSNLVKLYVPFALNLSVLSGFYFIKHNYFQSNDINSLAVVFTEVIILFLINLPFLVYFAKKLYLNGKESNASSNVVQPAPDIVQTGLVE
jgi:O-antigen/teichoic acid export membrane protein